MNKFSGIGEAARLMGVSVMTLRRWEREGKLIPERTLGRQRRYDLTKLRPRTFPNQETIRKTIAYARVSSHDQKADLERQKQMLGMYCAANGWSFEVISDLGSGMNYQKRGLRRILNQVIEGEVGRLVLTRKVMINQGDEPSFEEELAQDVLEIITVFSARLYGSRSRKNKKLMENLQSAVELASA